jgi:hypothetical protein
MKGVTFHFLKSSKQTIQKNSQLNLYRQYRTLSRDEEGKF